MGDVGMKKLISVFIWLFLVVPCWAEKPIVELQTNFGDIVVELDGDNAPNTVANFLEYVKSDFYDGLIFHRVIPDFMIQSGGYDTDLNKPTPSAPIEGENYNGLTNQRGTIAMALSGDPPDIDSATSQFYINLVHNTSLNGIYTVFGRVISDMNVVDRIAHLPTEYLSPVLGSVPRPPGPVIIYNADILGDLYDDSDVDFKDYSVFANQWLESGNSEPNKITASDGSEGDWFGFAVAVDANHAIIGAPKDDNQKGAAYIFEYDDGDWTQIAKLTASDGVAGDWFGGSVSISANHAIIGAPGDNGYTGSAYIFRRSDGNWTQQRKLVASDDDPEDWFGHSVSISGDCAIVGAWLNDANAVTDTGSAYVFYRHEGGTNNWGGRAMLTSTDIAMHDRFGYSVSINGEYAIIGAIGDDDNGDYSGSAYVFMYDDDANDWIQQTKLTPSDGALLDRFGWSVAIDGYHAIVGAYLNDENGDNSGAAYIFRYKDGIWRQTKLAASDAEEDDYFGYSVAISQGHAIVGAYGNDDDGSSSGSAYIFAPDGLDPNNWNQQAKLTAPDAAASDYFGSSVAIGVGRHAIFGAYGNDDSGSESGSAYIRLCPDADIDGDCSVTWNDLAILTDNWLLH